MEKTEPVVAPFAHSRESLKRLLIRNEGGGDEFPRSKMMRTIVDPHHRRLWVAGGTTLAFVLPVLLRVRKLGALTSVVSRLSKTILDRRY